MRSVTSYSSLLSEVSMGQVNTSRRPSFNKWSVDSLRRWRWWILILGLLLTLLVEILEHESPADPHFVREVFLYGMITPAITWVLLTLLARQAARHAEAEARSDWHQELNRNLEEHQEWTELTRFVAGFPATFLPVEHVSLFVYDHARAELCFVTDWSAFGLNSSPFCRYRVDSALCRSCSASKPSAIHPLVRCGFFSVMQPPAGVQEYCQPMVYNGLLVAVQLLRCRPGKDLSVEQREQLQASAAPIALALALAIARCTQMDQARRQAESDERQRVAAELHDSLGQMISYLHFSLDRLSNDERLHVFADIQRDLTRMLQVADSAYDHIRSDLWVMHSWTAPDIKQAIAAYIETTAQSSGLDIQLKIEGEPAPLEPRVSYQIFTLIREGLNNIVTHAQARHVDIELVLAADHLCIHLIDDGSGFDPARAFVPGHYGLRMMRERALALNGTMLIDSSPGRGTRLSFALPIAPAAAAPAAGSIADLHPLS